MRTHKQLALAGALVFAGCGGGGGAPSAPSTPPTIAATT
jgi:hypothetical protein